MSDREDGAPKSTAEKLQRKRENNKVLTGIASDGGEDYKRALNSMASSEHGKIVFKILINACGVFSPDKGADIASLIRQSERRNVYLELIRPYLEPKVKQELEK